MKNMFDFQCFFYSETQKRKIKKEFQKGIRVIRLQKPNGTLLCKPYQLHNDSDRNWLINSQRYSDGILRTG